MSKDKADFYTVKRYLLSVYRIDTMTEHLQQELKHLEYMAENIVKPLSDGGRGNLPGHPTEEIAIKISEKKARLLDQLVNLENQRDDIETYILTAGLQPIFERVLLKRYIELKTWEKVAREMHYSQKYIEKLHGIALRILAKKWRGKDETN